MDDENTETTTQETQTPDQSAAPTTPSIIEQPPKAGGKVITIPTKALDKRLGKAREQGKKEAMAEMEAKARSLGFKSLAELEQAVTRNRVVKPAAGSSAPRTEPTTPTTPGAVPAAPSTRSSRRLERENDRLLARVREHNRARANEERKRKAAEARNEALEAEMILRTTAIKSGVQDVDYGLELLRRKLTSLSADELRTFDEGKYFSEDLRKTHPYLYGVQERPAQTAAPETKQGGAPPPKKPEKKPTEKENGDVRSMPRDEYLTKLRGLGLNDPSAGF